MVLLVNSLWRFEFDWLQSNCLYRCWWQIFGDKNVTNRHSPTSLLLQAFETFLGDCSLNILSQHYDSKCESGWTWQDTGLSETFLVIHHRSVKFFQYCNNSCFRELSQLKIPSEFYVKSDVLPVLLWRWFHCFMVKDLLLVSVCSAENSMFRIGYLSDLR